MLREQNFRSERIGARKQKCYEPELQQDPETPNNQQQTKTEITNLPSCETNLLSKEKTRRPITLEETDVKPKMKSTCRIYD